MKSKTFAIVRGGPKRIELRAGPAGGQRILFDGSVVGEITDAAAFRRGTTVGLPDGSELMVQASLKLLEPGVRLMRNGTALPDSDFDPQRRATRAARLVAVVGVLQIVIGLVAATHDAGMISGDSLAAVGVGVVHGALSLIISRGKRWALGCAFGLLVADSLYQLAATLQDGQSIRPAPLFFRVVVALWMVQGLVGMAAPRSAEGVGGATA